MINILPNIIFSILLITSVGFFIYNIKKLITVIKLGKPIDRTDNPKKRLSNMIRIALGQSKMVSKPVSGMLHVIVYIGFIIINPIAWHKAASIPKITPVYMFPSTTSHLCVLSLLFP